MGEQKKSKNPRKKREERGEKKKRVVRFVSLCRVELDGRACTHCGKHPMVVAYLFARKISLDNAEEVKEKLEVMRAWSGTSTAVETIFYEPLSHFYFNFCDQSELCFDDVIVMCEQVAA